MSDPEETGDNENIRMLRRRLRREKKDDTEDLLTRKIRLRREKEDKPIPCTRDGGAEPWSCFKRGIKFGLLQAAGQQPNRSPIGSRNNSRRGSLAQSINNSPSRGRSPLGSRRGSVSHYPPGDDLERAPPGEEEEEDQLSNIRRDRVNALGPNGAISRASPLPEPEDHVDPQGEFLDDVRREQGVMSPPVTPPILSRAHSPIPTSPRARNTEPFYNNNQMAGPRHRAEDDDFEIPRPATTVFYRRRTPRLPEEREVPRQETVHYLKKNGPATIHYLKKK